jgi:MFS family permease
MSIPNRWQTNFRLLWGGHFLSVTSLTVIVPMLPFYMEQVGAGNEASVLLWSGFALAAPAITYALVAPLWGRLGDRSSRKWMVVRALLGLSCVLMAMGFVQTPFQLFVLRLLQGAFGGVVDAGAAFAGSESPKQQCGRVFGRLEGAVAAGSLVGPLLGGTMFGVIGFRFMFIILGSAVGLWAILSMFHLNETKRERDPEGKPAVSLIQVFRNLIGEKRICAFLCAGVCANFGAYGLITVFAPHVKRLTDEPAHAVLWVGILQAVTWASSWVASSWWGRKNDIYPVERNFILASVLCGMSILLQAVVPSIEWLIPLRILQGFGFSALLQSVFLVVSRSSKADERGVKMSSASSILVCGQMAGPLASGFMGSLFSPAVVFAQLGAAFIAGGLFVGWLLPNRRIRTIFDTKEPTNEPDL